MPPIADARARVLVLGSLPGVQSLREQRYYAHPRNHFWWVMDQVFAIPVALPYAARVQELQSHGVAVWDVLASGVRQGSLDSAIELASARVNDFPALLDALPRLQRIVFNGALAEALFQRHVVPTLPTDLAALPRLRLPSTSPANASVPADQKLARWRQALEP
ncbi:DNA-deoxyinosine glycosylase [Arenimonas sp. MALMAid1274]|uniref:DNA-deoxyinosine glycosylase n=1 Tax=Arenimonas sp. MALMAid1274 TaxID=3411630 RepID=UPI003BA0E04E